MRISHFVPRVLAAWAILSLSGAWASAQNCGPAGCGPTVSSGCASCVGTGTGLFGRDRFTLLRRPDGNQPACASRSYPLSDWAYIRKYCGPSLIPGSCYGHFPTNWRRWEEVCPNWGPNTAGCGNGNCGAYAYGGAPYPAPYGAYPAGVPQGYPAPGGTLMMPAPGALPPGTVPPGPGAPGVAPQPQPGQQLPPPTPLPGNPGTNVPPVPLPSPIPMPPGGGSMASRPAPQRWSSSVPLQQAQYAPRPAYGMPSYAPPAYAAPGYMAPAYAQPRYNTPTLPQQQMPSWVTPPAVTVPQLPDDELPQR